MTLVPFDYTLRSLFVRRASTLLTVVGVGATVAVLTGVLALQQGFQRLFLDSGRDDLVVLMRPGATSEGESAFPLERAQVLLKGLPEVDEDAAGPLAAGELYLAVRREKLVGGETNVPIRGVEAASLRLHGEGLRLLEGRPLAFGTDEVMVGRALVGRIRDCRLGQVIVLNTTPFRVVGVFDHDGPYRSEIWGDAQRMGEALERPGYNRILARVRPGTDVAALARRLADDPQVPCKVLTERAYLAGQSIALSVTLLFLGSFLALVMGTAAVFTGTNTMLAAVASRTHEIGVLLSLGFHPIAVFLSFLVEALLLGLLGGVAGCLMALPLHGLETGTTNFQTFTEIAFAFRITPGVLGVACGFALLLGLVGGALPALHAARLRPTEALRRE